MTDHLQHECGIAFVRLLKPLEYYQYKYGSCLYGLQHLHLMMEKQRNRGQDGAGAVCVKIGMPPGNQYISRVRSIKPSSLDALFKEIYTLINKVGKRTPELLNDVVWMKQEMPFAGEIYLGHLRYGTYGDDSLEAIHPVIRQNNWKTRNLILAGNFNLTNVDTLFNILTDLGQYPTGYSDTVTMLENIGHFLDRENQYLFDRFKKEGHENADISGLIAENISVRDILVESSKKWDGGYVISGVIGHGDAFFYRDPCGIRPAYYYRDEEVAAVASERPVIQTVFNRDAGQVSEIKPGYALIIKADGSISEELIQEPREKKSCSFERIYFSRGSDKDIYKERKLLGRLLIPEILPAIDHNLETAVFSYIPNTAETAFFGMVEAADEYLNERKKKLILEAGSKLTPARLDKIMNVRTRIEKVAVKDAKLRTFITQDKSRASMVGHVYDITYDTIRKGVDNLVIIDDSIVRGTTLKLSIIRILDRLGPKKIVFVSSSPQIRYPDCYGIDMARLNEFVAFQAAIALLKDSGRNAIINEVYKLCKAQENLPVTQIVNHVKEIYKPFTAKEISAKISELLRTPEIKADIEIIFQSIENLHQACPNDTGDWYFTGNYPTPGGNRVVNNAFINYIEGKNRRAY
ncbi:MAG: amidophosphoribosyltransferase [Bacteroidales bacterium]|jgi:amidophosphoribosyltransferase|nr:amidophosphoribosyltransferase [Bacteroidales bacterium]